MEAERQDQRGVIREGGEQEQCAKSVKANSSSVHTVCMECALRVNTMK